MVAILMQPSILAGCTASRASLSRILGTACLDRAIVLLYGTFFARRHWTRKELERVRLCGWRWRGFIMVRPWRETHRHGLNCALGSLRYQELVRHGVPRSPRAEAALSSGGEREMMTGRALAGSTRSTRATPAALLTGTDIGRKMAGGYTVIRCSTDEVTTKDEV